MMARRCAEHRARIAPVADEIMGPSEASPGRAVQLLDALKVCF
jgi:hypothetical protein